MNTAKFEITKEANPNYLCTICKIGTLEPIEGADKLVKTVVNGYDIVVSKDFYEGQIVVYFPLESSISESYLGGNNLYNQNNFEKNRNADDVKALIEQYEATNVDSEKDEIKAKIKSLCGFFEKNGRVRILKLRGHYSQGFIAQVETLCNMDSTLVDVDWESLVGTQFNSVNDKIICKKYVPAAVNKRQPVVSQGSFWKRRMKKLNKFDRLVENQFAYHYDTRMLSEHFNEIKPTDKVTITIKLHGTSVILSNILCKRKLSFFEKIKKFFHLKVEEEEYGNIYSSRSVIKNRYINNKVSDGFYGADIWGCVNRDFGKLIPEGYTIYGEIVGYIEDTTKFIQKNHDYGCKEGEWKFMPYRITRTDRQGNKTEYNVEDVDKWTRNLMVIAPELANKIMPLTIVYSGPMCDLYPDIPVDENWHQNVLARLKADKNFGMELNEPMCKNKVPREGIVIRVDDDICPRAWKLKCAAHYAKECKENDEGVENIEDNA